MSSKKGGKRKSHGGGDGDFGGKRSKSSHGKKDHHADEYVDVHSLLAKMKADWATASRKKVSTPEEEELRSEALTRIAALVKGHVVAFAVKKEASRIIQVCLKHGTKAQQSAIIGELVAVSSDNLAALACKHHFRHVLNAALMHSGAEEYLKLLKSIAEFSRRLLKNECGAKSLQHAVDTLPDLVGKARKSGAKVKTADDYLLEMVAPFLGAHLRAYLPQKDAQSSAQNDTEALLKGCLPGRNAFGGVVEKLVTALRAMPKDAAGDLVEKIKEDVVRWFDPEGKGQGYAPKNAIVQILLCVLLCSDIQTQLSAVLSDSKTDGLPEYVQLDLSAWSGLFGPILPALATTTALGAHIAWLLVVYGGKKARKSVAKAISENCEELAVHPEGVLVVLQLLHCTDDTSMIKKMIGKRLVEKSDVLAQSETAHSLYTELVADSLLSTDVNPKAISQIRSESRAGSRIIRRLTRHLPVAVSQSPHPPSSTSRSATTSTSNPSIRIGICKKDAHIRASEVLSTIFDPLASAAALLLPQQLASTRSHALYLAILTRGSTVPTAGTQDVARRLVSLVADTAAAADPLTDPLRDPRSVGFIRQCLNLHLQIPSTATDSTATECLCVALSDALLSVPAAALRRDRHGALVARLREGCSAEKAELMRQREAEAFGEEPTE